MLHVKMLLNQGYISMEFFSDNICLGWDNPHKLSCNSYWVLRLPYVYYGEGGAHLPHSTPPSQVSFNVLLGQGRAVNSP